LSSRKSKSIEKSLLKKGFKVELRHHKYLFFHDEKGKKTLVRTRLSHGNKEYDDGLLSQMKKQLHLDKQQLLDLIDCPMTYKMYLELLKKASMI